MHDESLKRPLSARFEKALVLAHRLHANQFRKGRPVPYIAHLLAVASLALEHGANEDEAIAALLHDAVEDQGGAQQLEAIREQFGPYVAMLVEGCSELHGMPKPPWRKRKTDFLARLREAPAGVRLIAGADKLHNLRTLIDDYRTHGEAIWERFNGGREGSLWYYRSIVATLKENEPALLVDELERALAELERIVDEQDGGS